MAKSQKCLKSVAFILFFVLINEVKSMVNLYDPVDNVLMVNSENLSTILYHNRVGKLVQFINSFCGDCRRFAPTFKRLSTDLQTWRHILMFYAIDCAEDINVKICREYRLLGTPTLRYFPPIIDQNNRLGQEVLERDVDGIKFKLSLLLSDIRNIPELPTFEPLNRFDTLKSIFDHKVGQVNHLFVVYKPATDVLLYRVLLDLLPYQQVIVRFIEDRWIFRNFGLEPYAQTLAVVDRSGNSLALIPENQSAVAYLEIAKQYLDFLGFEADPLLPTTQAPDPNTFLGDRQNDILNKVLMPPHKIYRVDIEQAIDKLLHIEIPKAAEMSEEQLNALRKILHILDKFHPLNAHGKRLISNLRAQVEATDKMSGAKFAELVKESEANLKVFKGRRYVGCISSRPFLRQFTCSMWVLFHYLTVQSAKGSNDILPGHVLKAVHAFAKYFFGCTDCSNHFQAMARRRKIDEVQDKDEEILWLWDAHNEVNKRVAGDSTEDPKFPKIQFPSRTDCPTCRNSEDGWNTDEVLKYLKHIYDSENVSIFGLPAYRGRQ
ncbi:hypothetical protein KR018_003168 [Drosophila ironensis]|nr:hypothetical protein KR018_003168 [Drosophila ironensis]